MNRYLEVLGMLTFDLLDAKEANKVGDFTDLYTSPIKQDVLSLKVIEKLDSDIVECYKMSNGIEFSWNVKEKDNIAGNMHFLNMEQVLQNWKGKLYEEEDIEENDLIVHFHPFDLITPEAQCGIMLGMEYEDNEIYFNYSSSAETFGLDVDFDGYMEMAKEARIFLYWPKVLLDIQNNEESIETQTFKENMPNIFPEFKWDSFVAKYEALRLSKK